MAILCGIKMSVVFTDLNDNIHCFSNDEKLSSKSTLGMMETLQTDVKLYKYTEKDVIFFNFLRNSKNFIL